MHGEITVCGCLQVMLHFNVRYVFIRVPLQAAHEPATQADHMYPKWGQAERRMETLWKDSFLLWHILLMKPYEVGHKVNKPLLFTFLFIRDKICIHTQEHTCVAMVTGGSFINMCYTSIHRDTFVTVHDQQMDLIVL